MSINPAIKLLFYLGLVLLVAFGCTEAAEDEDAVEPTDFGVPELPYGSYLQRGCGYEVSTPFETECGLVYVPENRDVEGSRSIPLQVTIIHGQNRENHNEAIFYLAGGPGQSATDDDTYYYFTLTDFTMSQERDVVLIDQRGTGSLFEAMSCEEEALLDSLSAEEQSEITTYMQRCQDYLLNKNFDLKGYNSVQSAADLDTIREALGYEKVSLYGVSYGTRLALVYMRDFEENVSRVVLDSVVPVGVNAYEDLPQKSSDSLDLLFSECVTDETCSFYFPNLESEYDTINARLEQGDLTWNAFFQDGQRSLSLSTFQNILFNLLYSESKIAILPYMIHKIFQEDYLYIEQFLGLDEAETASSIHAAMYYSVRCNEEIPFEALSVVQQQTVTYPAFAELFFDQSDFSVCEFWDSGTAEAIENENFASAVETMIISGAFDPITPPSYANTLASLLTNDTLITVQSSSHGPSFTSTCLHSAVENFLNPELGDVGLCDTDSSIEFQTTDPYLTTRSLQGPRAPIPPPPF